MTAGCLPGKNSLTLIVKGGERESDRAVEGRERETTGVLTS